MYGLCLNLVHLIAMNDGWASQRLGSLPCEMQATAHYFFTSNLVVNLLAESFGEPHTICSTLYCDAQVNRGLGFAWSSSGTKTLGVPKGTGVLFVFMKSSFHAWLGSCRRRSERLRERGTCGEIELSSSSQFTLWDSAIGLQGLDNVHILLCVSLSIDLWSLMWKIHYDFLLGG